MPPFCPLHGFRGGLLVVATDQPEYNLMFFCNIQRGGFFCLFVCFLPFLDFCLILFWCVYNINININSLYFFPD